jgi:hypothetical protein
VKARRLEKLLRMDRVELTRRGTTAARAVLDRARVAAIGSRWSRSSLAGSLVATTELTSAREALNTHRWDIAHRELARHFAHAPRRFAIDARSKPALVARILDRFPGAAGEAAARADWIVAGEYDLLGYRRLRFNTSGSGGRPDWSWDPVSGRRPPQAFWSAVPFLDASCGDHKVIWELNRHQHWLSLGRAFWLTAEPRYRDRFVEELASWLEGNPPLTGINWASMLEVALRSLSWLWAIHLFVEDRDDDSPWLVDLLVGLDRQLTHIEGNLSHYFSPNTHLLGEALALYVTGRALPELAASERRATIGRAILLEEIGRQIAADGGHCERSTHYHRYTLDFYALALIVARATGDHEAAIRFEEAVGRLAGAAWLLADDDGRVPHIGDDDGGTLVPFVERDPDDLRASLAVAAALVSRPELRVGDTPEDALWVLGANATTDDAPADAPDPQPAMRQARSDALPETGYYVSRSPAGHHLVIDGGPHGYQNGGHAHADALSVTLSVRGVPLLIDPGTGFYTADLALRDRMRSTALHNTLVLDGRSQSLPAGPFHWSHVANGQAHRWRSRAEFDYFDGSHDGYSPIEHRRRVLVLHGDLVVVADLVNGSGAHTAALHWHLDPRWSVETRARGAVLTRGAEQIDRVGVSVPEGLIETFVGDDRTSLGWFSSAYGRLERTTTIRIACAAAAPYWMITVFDLDRSNEVADVTWVPVRTEAGAVAHATAIRIARTASVDHVLFAEPAAETTHSLDPGEHAAAERLWRVGDVETDARMLFYRTTSDQAVACMGLVDGSVARAAGSQGIDVTLPQLTPTFFFGNKAELRTASDQRGTAEDHQSCAASPAS